MKGVSHRPQVEQVAEVKEAEAMEPLLLVLLTEAVVEVAVHRVAQAAQELSSSNTQ